LVCAAVCARELAVAQRAPTEVSGARVKHEKAAEMARPHPMMGDIFKAVVAYVVMSLLLLLLLIAVPPIATWLPALLG